MRCPKCSHDVSLHYDVHGVAVCVAKDWVYRHGGLTGYGEWRIGECTCQTQDKRVLAKVSKTREDALSKRSCQSAGATGKEEHS